LQNTRIQQHALCTIGILKLVYLQNFASAAEADRLQKHIAGLKGLLHPHRGIQQLGKCCRAIAV